MKRQGKKQGEGSGAKKKKKFIPSPFYQRIKNEIFLRLRKHKPCKVESFNVIITLTK